MADGSGELRAHELFPVLASFQGWVEAHFENSGQSGEIVIEHEVVGMAHAGDCDEDDAGSCHGSAELHDDFLEESCLVLSRV